ncbi:PLP-dependent aminotransferase family protein [Niallia sp. NCCP-28]|uniref:aminotransferase-like domain-containing protein n=1 Tax=Niallia sp. NCCP-28 TaxID=2934712 RepID=UPI0020860AAB|nr:PLP-dependent aminotransferase family protein [Niallia sp. NCCP-28]GKU84852.1 aminotransferase [Niallia sp. NCCP-28]
MNYSSFFPENVKKALQNDPPGAWMSVLPKGCIRLNSGYPAPNLVPAQQIKAAVDALIKEEQDLPFHYIGSSRTASLPQQIQKRLATHGISVRQEELLVTSGACQGIDLIARSLLDEEAVVAVEAPTYMEALEIFKNYTNHIIDIPVDEDGLNTDHLEGMLEERKQAGLPMPRLLYTIPTFHNPTGTTMPLKRRKHMLKLAAAYDFLILEDAAYGELSFCEGVTPCKAIDEEGRVIYVGSLSKVIAPGMRVGWIAGAQELIAVFDWFKKDLGHPFSHATMTSYLEGNALEDRLHLLREVYQARCQTMLKALGEYLPAPITWHIPKGGYFIWVKTPGIDTQQLLEQALAIGVAYVPGKYFFLHQQEGTEYLRLSFSYAEEQDMVKGIRKLGELFASYYKK